MTENKQARRRSRQPVEASDYAAFVLRIAKGLGDRIGNDPAILAHVKEIQQAFSDNINRGIFVAKNKEWQPYTLAEMGRIYGCSYENVQQRASRGEAVHVALQAKLGKGALVRIADIRAQRAAALAAAHINDVTGSERECMALGATGTDSVRS